MLFICDRAKSTDQGFLMVHNKIWTGQKLKLWSTLNLFCWNWWTIENFVVRKITLLSLKKFYGPALEKGWETLVKIIPRFTGYVKNEKTTFLQNLWRINPICKVNVQDNFALYTFCRRSLRNERKNYQVDKKQNLG